MKINEILKGMDCSCGKKHSCPIEYVYVEKGATQRIAEICKDYKTILVVADENTYSVAGEMVLSCLADKCVKTVIFSGKTVLIPNEEAIDKVNENIDGIDMIVGIGSGVIQDLCKYVSFFSKIPYIIVATAPSMDGYASDGAAMILRGMKETVKAGLPKAIIADVDVLKNAPIEMIKAGYGDIIGKYSALCDWKLSKAVNGEYFCDYIYDTTYRMIQETKANAKGIVNREEESIKILAEALVIVGIMMSFATSSRPASGSEHHLSHFFEIVGIVNDEKYLAHGIDVAYSTVVTAEIREKIRKSEFPDKIYRMNREEYEDKIREIYKSVADECILLQDKVGNYSADRICVYKEKYNEILDILSEMPSAKEIEEILGYAGLDMTEFYGTYPADKVKDAVLYAKDLKDRYTVLWLYYDLFGGDEI